MTYRVLVTGSRGWKDSATIRVALSAMLIAARAAGERMIITHGYCPDGADALTDEIALQLGVPREDIRRRPADWKAHGRPAGMIRNAAMVKEGHDVCLVFLLQCTRKGCAGLKPHGTHGTTGCMQLARDAGIPVRGFGFGFGGS